MPFKDIDTVRAYKAKNAARIREINRAYRERNRERIAAREREKARARKAAMTPEQLAAERERRRERARARRLNVDPRPIRAYTLPEEPPDLPTVQVRVGVENAPKLTIARPTGLAAWIPLGGEL